jgi:hypothetical protein
MAVREENGLPTIQLRRCCRAPATPTKMKRWYYATICSIIAELLAEQTMTRSHW